MWSFGWPALLPLAGFLLTLALGVFAWCRRGNAPLQRSFAALNLVAAAWNLDVLLLFALRDGALAARLDRALQPAIVAIPAVALLFVFRFLGRPAAHPALIAAAVWTSVLAAASWTDAYLSGWSRHWFGWYGEPGPLYPLFVATLLGYLALSSTLLVREARATRGHRRRTQAHWLLIGNLVLGLASLTNFLPLWGVPVLPLGNLASVAYAGIMAYTIARHRLLDLEVLFRAGMLYSSLTFLLAALSLALVLGLQRWLQAEVFAGSVLLPMLPAITVGVAAGPLKGALQERLDRTFFRSRGEMRTRLAEFSAVLAGLEREEEVWRAAWEEGWRWAHPERGIVLLADEGGIRPLREQGTGPGEREGAAGILAAGGGVRRLAPGSGFEVAVPVVGREGLLGGALVGAKASGEIWSAEDLAFLDGIAGQAALAVERVRLAARLRREERLAALGRASAVIAHELRNPLNVMRGAAAVLRREAAGTGASPLGVIEAEIERGERFIRDVLAACRVPRPRLVPIDAAGLVRELSAAWPAAAPAGARLEATGSAKGLWVLGDAFQLRQAIENLARNAAEAGAGRIEIEASRDADGGVALVVADDGPGIAAAALANLYEPFCTTRRGGTGLGLSIVRGIVEGHGGRIAAANRAGAGAVFTMRIPGAPAPA